MVARSRLGKLLRAYTVQERPLETTTTQVVSLNPAIVATNARQAGPLMGVDAEDGTPISTGAHELYEQKRVTSPNVTIIGDVGSSKSSLAKTAYGSRSLACGKRVAAFDRKNQQGSGEYDKLVDMVGPEWATNVRFARDGGTSINLLDPRISRSSSRGQDGELESVGQDALLEMVAGFAHGTLTSEEHHALRAAHRAALQRAKAAGTIATIRDVIDALFTPGPDSIPHERLKDLELVDEKEVTRWGMTLAMDLQRLVDGDLSGLLDGETSSDVDWDARLLVFDTSSLDEGTPELSLVMAVVSTFLSAVWTAKPGKKILIVEEGYMAAKLKGFGVVDAATILRGLAKRGRGAGLAVVVIVHHISDIPDDSDAMSLIRESQVVHIYRQSRADDRKEVIEAFGIPEWCDGLLANLEQGHHILRVGNEDARFVRHVRTAAEVDMTDTERAMLGHDVEEPA